MSTIADARAKGATALYVFGVVPSDDATRVLLEEALDDRSVRLVPLAGVAAVAAEVPLESFSEDALAARLEDLSWLGETARRHEEVLEAALAAAPVVPFRLCTLYSSEAELGAFLDAHAGELQSALERVRDRVELGVKAFLDHRRLEATLAAESGDEAGAAPVSAGRAYLLRRRREQALGEEVDEVTAIVVSESHERLSAAAEDAVLLEPQPAELSGRPERMVLNGAYLVRSERRAAFADAVAGLADRFRDAGIAFEQTGPWPAYNFVPRELPPRRAPIR